MSLQLGLLNFLLRRLEKPRLARLKDAEPMRRGLRRAAALLPKPALEIVFEPAPAVERAPPIEWCRPPDAGADQVILYFHGGAYVAGAPSTHRQVIAPLAQDARALAAAPDYRLAPEHPFPAALDDAVASYERLLAQGFAPRSIALAGDSAGGGLAFALLAEIARLGLERPAGVAAFSPFLDLTLSGATHSVNARRDSLLPAHRVADAVASYLGGADPADPRASPLFASIEDPPPALIQVGDQEILLDDSRRMAESLRRAGGDVRLEIWRDAPHAWHFFWPVVPEARRAVAAASAFLVECFAAPRPARARAGLDNSAPGGPHRERRI